MLDPSTRLNMLWRNVLPIASVRSSLFLLLGVCGSVWAQRSGNQSVHCMAEVKKTQIQNALVESTLLAVKGNLK